MAIYFSDEAQTRAGHLVNFASLSDQTRRTLSGSVSNQEMLLCDFGNYDKKESGSIIVFECFCAGKNDASEYVALNVKIGASYDGSTYITAGGGTGSTTPSGIYTATPSLNGLKHVKFTGIIENHTTTGAQKIITTYRSADGGNDKPFPLVNPTSTDNSALEGNPGMNGSRINIWEVLL